MFLYSNLLRLGSPAPETSIVKLVTILELKMYIEKTTWAVKGSQSIKVGNYALKVSFSLEETFNA